MKDLKHQLYNLQSPPLFLKSSPLKCIKSSPYLKDPTQKKIKQILSIPLEGFWKYCLNFQFFFQGKESKPSVWTKIVGLSLLGPVRAPKSKYFIDSFPYYWFINYFSFAFFFKKKNYNNFMIIYNIYIYIFFLSFTACGTYDSYLIDRSEKNNRF